MFDEIRSGVEAKMVESGAVVILSRASFHSLLSSESRELAAKLAWNVLDRSMSKLGHLGAEHYRHPERIQSDKRTTVDMEAADRDQVTGEESTRRADGRTVSGSSATESSGSGETTGGSERDEEWVPEDTLVPERERDETRTSQRAGEAGRGEAEREAGDVSDRDRDFGRDDAKDTERLVGILRDAAEQVADEDEEADTGQSDEGGDEGSARETMQMESFDKDSSSRD
jgi:hypothetical protein